MKIQRLVIFTVSDSRHTLTKKKNVLSFCIVGLSSSYSTVPGIYGSNRLSPRV